jgi:hypothetical protein
LQRYKRSTLKIIQRLKNLSRFVKETPPGILSETPSRYRELDRWLDTLPGAPENGGPPFDPEKLGDWHRGDLSQKIVRALVHDQVLLFLSYLADSSDRMLDKEELERIQETVDQPFSMH